MTDAPERSMPNLKTPPMDAHSVYPSHAAVLRQGRLVILDRTPMETDERAMDRAWWVARTLAENAQSVDACIGQSRVWCRDKYSVRVEQPTTPHAPPPPSPGHFRGPPRGPPPPHSYVRRT